MQTLSKQKINLFNSLIDVFYELHKKRIIHRDVKPANVLVEKTTEDKEEKYTAILNDFGMAVLSNDNVERSKAVGSPIYWAPEYAEAVHYAENRIPTWKTVESVTTPSIDIWGLGVTLYYIFAGENQLREFLDLYKLYNETDEQKLKTIYTGNINTRLDNFINNSDPSLKPYTQMIWEMLSFDPWNRPTAEDLKKQCDSLKTSNQT